MSRIAEFPEILDDRQKELAERIASGPRGRVRGPLALWLYSPDLCERAQHLGEFLRFGTSFDKRLSELTIITCAAHFRCEYEWAVHAPIAEKAGLSPDAIAAIKSGDDPQFAEHDEQVVYRATRELLSGNRMSQSAFDAVIELFGERGIVELTAIMGYYALGAFLLNATEMTPPDGSHPFPDNV
ncbi:carboxymuconolactone decarboxylase family protein [Hoeflea sp.]|uniref:carboxymuconolactone decarboxylase family protein n=1 Tax=Hoeflea sp. TaxID=1940281 RepID=UPI003B02EAE6